MRTNRLDEAEFIAFLKDVSKNMVFCRRSLDLAFVESQEQLAPTQCSPLNLLGASVFPVGSLSKATGFFHICRKDQDDSEDTP